MATPEIQLHDASDLSTGRWRELQRLQHDAISEDLRHRQPADIDAYVGTDDFGRFEASRVDPNTEVGRNFLYNQEYTRPRVALAIYDYETVGYAYTADNVSGGGSPDGPQNDSLKARAIRSAKRLSVVKNYLWVREIAVHPGFRNRGIATKLGRVLLEDAKPSQPVSTYIYPTEFDGLQELLERLGFASTGESEARIFGELSTPVPMVRMQADSVADVLEKLG